MKLALPAKKLVLEGRRVRESMSKRRSTEMSQPSKNSKNERSYTGTSSIGFFRVPPSQSKGRQIQYLLVVCLLRDQQELSDSVGIAIDSMMGIV